MLKCPRCNSENVEGSSFCINCGGSMLGSVILASAPPGRVSYVDIPPDTIIVCPKCGTKNMRTDISCRKCEANLDAAKAEIAAKSAHPKGGPPTGCLSCGRELIPGARFCAACGAPILAFVPGQIPSMSLRADPDVIKALYQMADGVDKIYMLVMILTFLVIIAIVLGIFS